MSRVYLNIGSNIDRERHLRIGLDALADRHGELAISSVYESAAVGFCGDPFLNLAVLLETGLGVGELHRSLRSLEFAYGRPQNASRFSARTLDIDLLTYDDRVGVIEGVELPRPEILENAFVLAPLAELAPQVRHPVDGRRYAELWECHDRRQQALVKVDFHWRGRRLSTAGPA